MKLTHLLVFLSLFLLVFFILFFVVVGLGTICSSQGLLLALYLGITTDSVLGDCMWCQALNLEQSCAKQVLYCS